MIQTRVGELILKHLSGEMSDDKRLELDKIIASSDEYKKLYEDLTDPHKLVTEIERMRNWHKEASWKKIEATLFPPK